MNDELFAELIRSLLKDNPELSITFRTKLMYALDKNSCAVWWQVEDFEYIASSIEDQEGVKYGALFDRSKFHEALEDMCVNTSCDVGVSWETVEDYIRHQCGVESN